MNRQIKMWDRLADAESHAAAAMWSPDSQVARFRRAVGHAQPGDGETVLDWGCNRGRLYEWIDPGVHYIGVDWSPRQLEQARSRCGSDATLMTPDEYTGQADCVFALGTWNLRMDWSFRQTGEELARLFTEHTRRVLVASFYYGEDPTCLRYQPSDLAGSAAVLTNQWLLQQWRHNDLMLVLHR
jgi:SAM-dependent methyltransferase